MSENETAKIRVAVVEITPEILRKLVEGLR